MNNKEKFQVSLRYKGADVDNGTMNLDDIIPALRAFSELFSDISSQLGISSMHELRVSSVKQGSFELGIDILSITQHIAPVAISTLAPFLNKEMISATMEILFDLIKINLFLKGEAPQSIKTDASKGKVEINGNNNKITINYNSYNLYKNPKASKHLEEFVAPLKEGKIDNATLIYKKNAIVSQKEIIKHNQKDFFQYKENPNDIRETKHIHIYGYINALTKSTNRGKIMPNDGGKQIKFKLSMPNPQNYYQYFDNKLPLKIECMGHYLNGELEKVEIFNIFESDEDIPSNGKLSLF